MTPNQNKAKIAIIEDDPSLVQMYHTKFELEGYDVQTASDGLQGLALIEQFKPDVVLLDLLMPNMGGAEMLEELRRRPGGAEVKVMVLTNVDDNITTTRVYRSGPIDYIIKSNVTVEEIFERVKKLLNPA